jgi:hypothetical protein
MIILARSDQTSYNNVGPCHMAQAVSRLLLTAEARVNFQGNPCGICGAQSDTGTGFCSNPSVSPVSIIPPLLHIHSCIIWRMENGPFSGQIYKET